jgi:hypothetical protein
MPTAPAPVAAILGGECPDCGAGDGQLCHWDCPRYAEVLYDSSDEGSGSDA